MTQLLISLLDLAIILWAQSWPFPVLLLLLMSTLPPIPPTAKYLGSQNYLDIDTQLGTVAFRTVSEFEDISYLPCPTCNTTVNRDTTPKVRMYFPLLVILSLFGLVIPAEINPHLYENQLRFPWGVNFKYNGILHHNLARVWIVTKFPLPAMNKFYFPSFNLHPQCDFNSSSSRGLSKPFNGYLSSKGGANPPDSQSSLDLNWARPWLRHVCENSLPILSLVQRKDNFYRSKLQHLVEHDLYGNLLSHRSAGRSKRFAAIVIPAIAGLVTLAVESLSGYLQNRCQKAMAKAMDALQQNQKLTFNQLHRYKDDLLLYGTYNLKSTESILDALQGLYHGQSSLERHITRIQDSDWPKVYLRRHTGLVSYVAELNFFLHSVSNKLDFLYSTMIDEVEALIKGIATLSRGRLPPELFPPSFLQNVTHRVMSELLKSNTGYRLAFPQIDAYYDMKVATFALDKDNNLIVTFPILIAPIHQKPLSLYEIETVPVPIVDMDKSADSFSEVHVNKPYIAASQLSYIQLREPELQRCKIVQQQYYCEEAFMVKHAKHDTCESALFYNRDNDTITKVCNFGFIHNSSPVPSVLDGGSVLVLANFHLEHSPTCHPQLLQNLPNRDYTLTQREVLCNCTLQSNLAYLPRDLGACASNFTHINFTHSPNAAFSALFKDILHSTAGPPRLPSDPLPPPLNKSVDFPINLTLLYNVSSSLSTLKSLHNQMLRNLSSFFPHRQR